MCELERTDHMLATPRDEAVDLASSLSYRAPTLIPLARVDPSARSLSRPSSHELSEALKQMIPSDERAERLARECGRSVTILARRMPRGERPRPPWAASEGLIAALIAGAWDDAFEGDKAALEALTGRNYAAFEREMRSLLSEPEPMEHEGSVWKVRAPVDTFVELGSQITRHDIERLRSVVGTVFGEIDPALDLPVAERRFAQLRGKKMRHSDWLRDGLATTLLQIAVLYDEARFQVTGISAQNLVDELVRSLPGLEQDARLMISLSRQLPWLIEAAPSPLLDALEHLLEGEGARILPIFEEGDSFFPASYHTHVLWALEVLAWDPRLLNRTALALAALARIDPGGRLTNRPIASLTSVFRPWLPQTKATLLQRLAAIDLIIAQEPEIGWKLILTLLPARPPSIGNYNPKPHLREPSPADQEILTRGIVYQTYGEIVNRAIRLAHGNWNRVLALVKAMDVFKQEEMERVCDELEKVTPVVPDDQRLSLWTEVRDTVSMHTAYQEAQWAFPPPIVARLRSLQQRLAPVDPILKVKWLFDEHYPQLDHAPGVERGAAVEEVRSAAISQLRSELGEAGLAELARRAKFPGLVGMSAAGSFGEVAEFDHMLTIAFSFPDISDLFLTALSSAAHRRFGTEWVSRIVDRASKGLAPAQLASLVLGWEDERTAWDLAGAFGPEVVQSYWSRRGPYVIRENLADQERAAREYLKAGSAIDALRALGHVTKELAAELVFEILDQVITEINRGSAPVVGDLSFEIGRTFENLAVRQDLSQADLARREYQYLPILKHHGNSLTLHRLMATEGAFFESVLCDVFRSASGGEEDATPERKARSHYGYELLSSMTLVPGFIDQADEAKLFGWVSEVRRLAAEHDRAKVADQLIGQVLAHCPADPADGAWPHQLVRKLIEELKSDEVERGIGVGRFNMGGAHAIDPKFPAALERGSAATARRWAMAASKWHRTSAMLNSLADQWESVAIAWEQRGRQEAMRDS
jgi:hypothetical protein